MVPADMAAVVSRMYADGRTANQIAGMIGISSDFARRLIRTAVAADPAVKSQHDRMQAARPTRRRYRGAKLVMTDEEKVFDAYPYPAVPTLDDTDDETIDPRTGEPYEPWEEK